GLPIFLLLIAMTGFMVTKEWIWLVMPLAFLALVWGIRDFRLVYLLIWASIPFAIEIDLPGGLSTDLPSEQLMWLSFLLLPAYLVLNRGRTNFRFIFQPIFILLFLHFSWIVITSITSQEPLISFKYTLAKTWYLVCFIVIPILLLKDKADYQRWGLFLFIPLVASIVIILIRHSFYGFTFSTINNAIIPIYRNHVDYACCIALALPFAWWQRRAAEDRRLRWFYTLAMILIVTGIYFSFTRAAWVCVPLSIGSYFLIRWKLLRIVIPVALAGVILFTAWLSYDNRYISYSPDYRKAITHKNFEDLVSATYKMEDISTVERFYRWVAGYYMVKEKPWLGSGPASFYSLYQNYVDRHFTTYVSNNPEHSGIHNYYLMTAVEQGVIGLMIFLALIMMVMISGEQLYHRMKPGAEQKLVMAALISFICNLFILTLNDTVETDKLGTFFFFCIAIIMVFLLREKETVVA
ncbi:MAG TPA: O-antigen ligase family protein, partial [Saprospiraceae bacterium]|nr:O-antigen ligase family protein [Saprospiraceae bacterium]